jgi:adenylate cyclase
LDRESGGKIRITFLPGQEQVVAEEGATILDAARGAGVPIASSCFGEARCGSCLVQVVRGAENLNEIRVDERDHLPGPDRRLACRARVYGPVTVVRVRDPEDDLERPATPAPGSPTS